MPIFNVIFFSVDVNEEPVFLGSLKCQDTNQAVQQQGLARVWKLGF